MLNLINGQNSKLLCQPKVIVISKISYTGQYGKAKPLQEWSATITSVKQGANLSAPCLNPYSFRSLKKMPTIAPTPSSGQATC